MASSASPSSFNSSQSPTDTFSSARFPLEGPVHDLEEAVDKLEQRPSDELRRARKHHRRALESLHNGAYDALSDRTRDQLVKRLHSNLQALNTALDTTASTE